jgi:hypothetical protein
VPAASATAAGPAIYEMLVINDAVRQLCLEKADAGAIRNAALPPAWSACASTARARCSGPHHRRGGHPHHRGNARLMALYAYKGIGPPARR